jgi:hypothetical protein
MKDGLALAQMVVYNVIAAELDSTEDHWCIFSGAEVWLTEPATIYAECIDFPSPLVQFLFNIFWRNQLKWLLC